MSRRTIIFMKIAIVLLIVGGLAVLSSIIFKVEREDITYVGNNRYSDEEMTKKIFGDNINTLMYTVFESKNQEKIPFIQKYDVEVVWPDKMVVTIYEKPMIGYIKYMGSNMYFDKDGMIVESSPQILESLPQITGISFDSIVLNEKLKVEDDSIFDKILEYTQDFDKNELQVDRLHFDSELDATLYIGDVKVLLGDNGYLSEKIHELKQVVPYLEGRKGVLSLEEYTPKAPNIVFKKEK